MVVVRIKMEDSRETKVTAVRQMRTSTGKGRTYIMSLMSQNATQGLSEKNPAISASPFPITWLILSGRPLYIYSVHLYSYLPSYFEQSGLTYIHLTNIFKCLFCVLWER